MNDNKPSSSWWDRLLDFLEASAEIIKFGAAIGAPIAAGVERRKIIKAQDASWLMRQEYYRNKHSNRYAKQKKHK